MRKAVIIALASVAILSPNQAQNTVPLLDSIVSYKFIGGQDSVPFYRWEYHYNPNGIQVFCGQYSWSTEYGKWVLVESDNWVLNPGGYRIEQVEYEAYERGLGYPYVKHEWEYDTNGKPLIMSQYHKFGEAEGWIPDIKEEFKNDPDGMTIQKLRFVWNAEPGDWYPRALYTFEYNSFGAETIQYVDFWDSGNDNWKRDSKIEASFDPQGVKRSLYWYDWNSEQSDWTRRNDKWMEFDSLGRLTKQMETNIGASSLTEYVYDSTGNFIIYLSVSPPWIGDFNPKTKFIITTNEYQERKIVDQYHLIGENWVPFDRTENMYGPLGIILQTNGYTWVDGIGSWNLVDRSHYYYQSSSSEVITVADGTQRIFPNPTSGILNIDGLTGPARVKVYSLQGQLLKAIEQVKNTIDISDLPAGVYILNLATGNKIPLRKRVVKQ